MKEFEKKTLHQLNKLDQEVRKLKKQSGSNVTVVDEVEENNKNAVSSGAVYNHVAEQVGNIEILLETI